MELEEFKNKYKIEDATPFTPEKLLIGALDLFPALKTFIDERFRGIAELQYEIRENKSIYIAPEYTAFLFKLIIVYLGGRSYLSIKVYDYGIGLKIKIISDELSKLAKRERADIIKAARNAGFVIDSTESGFELNINFNTDVHMKIYAHSISETQFYRITDEIFFMKPVSLRSKSGKKIK